MALAAAASLLPCGAVAADSPDLEEQFHELIALVPGTYDNGPQVAMEVNMGIPPVDRHEHVTMVWTRTERPPACCPGNFAGPDAAFFYVQTYFDGELVLNSERFVAVYIDTQENAIRWQNMKIKNPHRYAGLHLESSKFESVELMPARTDIHCKTLWRRVSPGLFRGSKKNSESCTFRSEYSGKQRRIENRFELTTDYFSYLDRGFEDGRIVYGRTDGVGHKMFRIY